MRARAAFVVAVASLALAGLLPAQIVASGAVALPSRAPFSGDDLQAGGRVGLALPPAPHVLALWNLAGVTFDRDQQHNGAALETGLEVWLSPARRPAQSWAPLLIGEAALGRRWGTGLHGYESLGIGFGWSLGNWAPYAEYRRRAGFHAASPVEHAIVIGVHFILFG